MRRVFFLDFLRSRIGSWPLFLLDLFGRRSFRRDFSRFRLSFGLRLWFRLGLSLGLRLRFSLGLRLRSRLLRKVCLPSLSNRLDAGRSLFLGGAFLRLGSESFAGSLAGLFPVKQVSHFLGHCPRLWPHASFEFGEHDGAIEVHFEGAHARKGDFAVGNSAEIDDAFEEGGRLVLLDADFRTLGKNFSFNLFKALEIL